MGQYQRVINAYKSDCNRELEKYKHHAYSQKLTKVKCENLIADFFTNIEGLASIAIDIEPSTEEEINQLHKSYISHFFDFLDNAL